MLRFTEEIRITETGSKRTDWGKEQPSVLPVKAKLWLHIKGLDQANAKTSWEQLIRQKLDKLDVHADLRIDWRVGGSQYDNKVSKNNYDEGVTIFLGNAGDTKKLWTEHNFAVDLKDKEARGFNNVKNMNGFIIPPGQPGNEGAVNTWSRYDYIADINLIPSRLRYDDPGKRYFEFYFKVTKVAPQFQPKQAQLEKTWNGLWGITEEAGVEQVGSVKVPFLLTKFNLIPPYWIRNLEKKADEIRKMKAWERPAIQQIEKFLNFHFHKSGG